MISKECKERETTLCFEKQDIFITMDNQSVTKSEDNVTVDMLGKHSQIINSVSSNCDRIMKAKTKAIWRLSFEVSTQCSMCSWQLRRLFNV